MEENKGIEFDITDYSLHNNEQKLIMVDFVGKFNEMFEALGTGFLLADEDNEYNDFVVLKVIEATEDVTLKKGDVVITKMCYMVSIKDVFEGYSGKYDNSFIIPERLIEGVMYDDRE